jgi:phage terminase large subunit
MSLDLDLSLDTLIAWKRKPHAMVEDLFGVKPDPWRREALEAFPHTPRMAMKACAGPGKTALLAWLGWNFLLTRPHPMVGVTSVNAANLRANLWTELARWYAAPRAAILRALFTMTKTEIFANDHPQTWRLEARTWAQDANAEQIGNALAGLHAKYVMWLLDESGAYPDSIMPVCETVFAGDPTEAHIVQAGNPTHLAGPLYAACTKARRFWRVIEITADPDNPKRTTRVSVEHARQQIAAYGRDNPWVKVRVFGEFPPASLNSLIGPDEVSAAMKRRYSAHQIGNAAKIIGVDVARFGDDESALAFRQGIQAFPFKTYRNLDSTQGAALVARAWEEFGADACFVDDTGGFGAGWIDGLTRLGRSPVGVGFAAKPNDGRYFNKRAEMAFECVQWIRRGGALPESANLLTALTQTTYTFQGDKLLLEPKADLKERIGFSPDELDALILTHSHPVTVPDCRRRYRTVEAEFNPFREPETYRVSSETYDCNPFE